MIFNLIKNVSIIFFLVIIISDCVFSQDGSRDTVGVKGDNWFAYPYAFYTPETSLAFGAGGIFSFSLSEKLKSKPSSITGSGYYTINNQYDITLQSEIYFAEDKYKLWSKFN
ncbi:unnamed protein product, partial [marine sediment metagenome]